MKKNSQLYYLLHSGKFMVGFVILVIMLFVPVLFPLFNKTGPLDMTGGLFYPPGTYVSAADVSTMAPRVISLDTIGNKIDKYINKSHVNLMVEWLKKYTSVDEGTISDAAKTHIGITNLWMQHYDPTIRIEGTAALRNEYMRLHNSVTSIFQEGKYTVVDITEDGEMTEITTITPKDYVRIDDIPNTIHYPLGTDNFGRDVLAELMLATKTSLRVGLIAGTVAMIIGLTLGLLAGYIGGLVDNIIMFVTNMFIVIPSFIILVLISVSMGSAGRNISTVSIVIGLTSWPWTTRSVRSQTISLRNRDHVNLSKLSNHSLVEIILKDILPYVASYVVMAYILQISSGILSEAQLSMLGLGPSSTDVSTLGVMMNWAIRFQASMNGAWWAFFPVIISITLISFSLNLMNSGLDQIFNPQLRN